MEIDGSETAAIVMEIAATATGTATTETGTETATATTGATTAGTEPPAQSLESWVLGGWLGRRLLAVVGPRMGRWLGLGRRWGWGPRWGFGYPLVGLGLGWGYGGWGYPYGWLRRLRLRQLGLRQLLRLLLQPVLLDAAGPRIDGR